MCLHSILTMASHPHKQASHSLEGFGQWPAMCHAKCQTERIEPDSIFEDHAASAASPTLQPTHKGATHGPACQLHWTPIGVPRELRRSAVNATADAADQAVPLSGLRRIHTATAAAAYPPSQLLTASSPSACSSASSEFLPEIDTAAVGDAEADGQTPSNLLDTGRFSAFSNDLFAADEPDEDVPNIGTPSEVGFAGFSTAAGGGSARAAAASATVAAVGAGSGGWGKPATEWGSFVSGTTPASALPMQLFAMGAASTPAAAGLSPIANTPLAALVAGLPVTPGVWGSAAPSAIPSAAPCASNNARSSQQQHLSSNADAPLRSLDAALAACMPLNTKGSPAAVPLGVSQHGMSDWGHMDDHTSDVAPRGADQDPSPSPCAPAPIPSHSPRLGQLAFRASSSDGSSGAGATANAKRTSGGGGVWRVADLTRISGSQAAAGKAGVRGSVAGGSDGYSAKAAAAGKRIEPFAAMRSSLDSAAAVVKRVRAAVSGGAGKGGASGSGKDARRLSLGTNVLKENVCPPALAGGQSVAPSALSRKSLPSGGLAALKPRAEALPGKGQQAAGAAGLRGVGVRASASAAPVAAKPAVGKAAAPGSRLPAWDAALSERVNEASKAVDSPGQVLKGVLRAQAQSIAVFGGPCGELSGLGVSPLVGIGRR